MRCVVTSGTEPPTYEFMEFTQELSVFDEVFPEASRSALTSRLGIASYAATSKQQRLCAHNAAIPTPSHS